MQTFHNMTVDIVDDNLSIEPGDDGRLEVTIRNNGNVDTYLDASLKLGNLNDDRIEAEKTGLLLYSMHLNFNLLNLMSQELSKSDLMHQIPTLAPLM